MLGPKNHPHLINLLATFHQNQYYHFIFPCADCNLRTYWTKNAVPNFNKKTVLWSIRQISGIASGLNCIHKFETKIDLDVEGGARFQDGGVKLSVSEGEEKYGRHGDLKPENILCFIKEGLLKITDFGLGRFHGRDSRSNIDPRKVVRSPTYEPPECTLERAVSRAYDIWSLACLFLEFATWLLAGAKQIDAFADARGEDIPIGINDDNFFTVFTHEDHEKYAKVRVAVIQWVDRLHAHEKCSELIHDLLDFIMRAMLKVDPAERIRAPDLKDQMEKLVQKAESSDTYLIRPAPRPLRTPPAVRKPSTGQKVRFADPQTPATSQTDVGMSK
jgi:serine/threonine protein kinase